MSRLNDVPLDVIGCDLAALAPAETARHAELLDVVSGAIREAEPLDSGYRFTLEPRGFRAAAEWITYERRCCAFFDFALEWPAASDLPWLTITGPEGVEAFLATFAKPAPGR